MSGTFVFRRVRLSDGDDENAMTLLNAAHTRLKNKEITKARELFKKAYDMVMTETQTARELLGFSKENKVTKERWEHLNCEGCYNVSPQALCGLAMCAMVSSDIAEARRIVHQVCQRFPFATQDLRDVAEAVVCIELLIIADFNVQRGELHLAAYVRRPHTRPWRVIPPASQAGCGTFCGKTSPQGY
ncbi:hypothetical protein TraAM80_06962 [Trypanosoma rangeli]|uniref:Uncharacterized protein n=1 Tax=Trypanosoma rangeli TaxID=5698 RepID=A0A3R7N7H3_TRYRA|nr:uncharacterized protein TraAM80_06962 [Trypanosoma rangeli]RNF01569.1 hypothetical protein TraAM80_06962 [Trypanosoma rangeli]|eukprot:RNF01569.1 hypothetical protein TraAM80_06962 [Trypanosoma rangeli]